MREIIVINSDGMCSPELCIKSNIDQDNEHKYIWGVGWYPNDHQSSMVIKDYFNQDSSIAIDDFTEWKKFRSTTFFATKKDAHTGEQHHDIQPYSRSYAGREWLFISNGIIDKGELQKKCKNKSLFLEPIGTSASELLFCYLLDKIQKNKARQIFDIKYANMASWIKNIDNKNEANLFLTDGSNTICYRGENSQIDIYYKRLSPEKSTDEITSDSMYLNFSKPMDRYRTKLIISSCQFDGDGWILLERSQLIVASRGDIIFSSNSTQLNSELKEQKEQKKDYNQRQNTTQEIKKVSGNKIITNAKSMVSTTNGELLQFKQYQVTHKTSYTYSNPVTHSAHKFKLQLVEDSIQEVVNSTLEISVNGEAIQYEDVFGNNTVHYTINEAYSEILITSSSQVKIYASPPDDHSLSRRQVSIPLVWMPWQRQMMTPYLLPVELPESELDELTTYAMSFVERNDYHLIKILDDINKTIYKDYEYLPGSTSINTSVFEVFSSRQGVCQDFANLFICLARLLSIPAKYRTGYIYTGGDYENKIQSDASHGWVEVFLPFVGWRGYDPTNGCMANQDHIRVACGRNYIDTNPTAGTIYMGGGDETLSIDVKIEEMI